VKPPLLEEARYLADLIDVQVGEERHTLKGLDRRTCHDAILFAGA